MIVTALVLPSTSRLAPPRTRTTLGFAGPAAALGQPVYGPPGTGLANHAAMPSLHVRWALLVALALVTGQSYPLEWLWLGHSVATVAATAPTGGPRGSWPQPSCYWRC